MLYPLYEYYSHSTLNLYEIRNHYLEHFYYVNHSKEEADNVLKCIVGSSRVDRLILKSAKEKSVPTYEIIMNIICSMFKFMFKSNETIALATIDTALRWDIEINSKLNLISSEELKQDILNVFKKLDVYEEMSDGELHPLEPTATVEAEVVEEPRKNLLLEHKAPKIKTWSLTSFIQEFGKMKVASFVNKTTGDKFKSCVCTNYKSRTFVAFSSKLGELTTMQIKEMKDNLIVIRTPRGKYTLAKKGKDTWEDVDI